MKVEKETNWTDGIIYRGKKWTDEILWWWSWTDGSLTKVTDSLWQCIFYEKQRNERQCVGFYRRSARKTKRRFDPRYKPIDKWHVSYAINASGQFVKTLYPWRPYPSQTVIQWSSSLSAGDFELSPYWLWHCPLSIYNRHLSEICHRSCLYLNCQPMKIEPSAYVYLTVTPISPLLQVVTDQMGWRGQLKRIKTENKAQRAWTSGPDKSIPMGQRKVKPILCVEPLIK